MSQQRITADVHSSPVWGCVLIGGESRRMGSPKHLLEKDGVTWLECIVSGLLERTTNVVISGNGKIPPGLEDVDQVADVPGLQGPLAGILSVFRAYPEVSWIFVACDMPSISTAALDWLLQYRSPGVSAVLPDLRGNGEVEPLFAYYDWNCRDLLEEKVVNGMERPGELAGSPGVISPVPPIHLHRAWANLNTPEEVPFGE